MTYLATIILLRTVVVVILEVVIHECPDTWYVYIGRFRFTLHSR